MEPRRRRALEERAPRRFRVARTAGAAAIVLAGVWGVLAADQRPAKAPASEPVSKSMIVAAQRVIVEFHMADLDRGWFRYSDGTTMVTNDGGIEWKESDSVPAEAGQSVGSGAPAAGSGDSEARSLTYVKVESADVPVKQSQFLTDRIGWALAAEEAKLGMPLLVTTDGGRTWLSEVGPSVRQAMLEEKQRQERIRREAALYVNPELAKKAMRAEWTLLPDKAFPGDAVLVRSGKPGEVAWQGKTYPLKAFGDGYFTYLPIPKQIKPGEYPIGGAALTVEAKRFETQQLTVSKQMESMRQDTDRIVADQKKIDAARSKSASEFLFASAFVQPVEGILTTPFGYTRYINGKLDSSHMAIDLAAKEGTPIQATNDGVVALADSLYLTGNSIYIDHGMGLFSQYAHLSELRVKTGDRVKRGDIIGLVGTTGFSTGPHLHFTFWAHNVPVNPNLFFGTTPFRWSEAEKGMP